MLGVEEVRDKEAPVLRLGAKEEELLKLLKLPGGVPR